MLFKFVFAGLFLFAISACSGVSVGPSRPGDPAFFIGAVSAEASANGLEFADGSQSIADTEEREMQIKLARFVRDPATGEARIVVSDETVTIPITFTEYGDRDIVMSFDGQALTFVDGEATLASGQSLWSYMNFKLAHSGTGAVYTYGQYNEGVDDPFDMEGYFAIGFETDPNEIAALSGLATYSGSYFGYVQTFDLEGSLTASEVAVLFIVLSDVAQLASGAASARAPGRSAAGTCPTGRSSGRCPPRPPTPWSESAAPSPGRERPSGCPGCGCRADR